MAPRKRKTAERLTFVEPELSAENEVRFQYGIDLFNTCHYWDAHESWEEIWQELGDEPEDDWEILLRGLIQIAAGLHCLFLKKKRGSRGNLKKGWSKITVLFIVRGPTQSPGFLRRSDGPGRLRAPLRGGRPRTGTCL